MLKIRKVRKSCFIRKLSYETELKELTVSMTSGVYVYYDVPWDVAASLWNAKSYGSQYNKRVKGQYYSTKIGK